MARVIVILTGTEWERAAVAAAESGLEIEEWMRRIVQRELARTAHEGVSGWGDELATLVQPPTGE